MTIQDISCIGRCSGAVALPILSAMGIETVVLPTAILSNHTAFPQWTIRDLTDEFEPITSAWAAQGVTFDAVSSGYLASRTQIDLVGSFMASQTGALTLVDPAMADHGRLYTGFNDAFAQQMARLCAQADVIVPNLTEGCIMTETPYREDADETFYQDIARRLADKGSRRVVLTGFTQGAHAIGALSYDREQNTFDMYVNERLPVAYHGTGDIFASVMLGGLMRGFSLCEATALAVDYVRECIACTMADPERRSYGVNFEEAIPYLVDRIRVRD